MRTCVFLFLLPSLFLFSGCRQSEISRSASADGEWPSYQGGDDRNQYSQLNQITPENVAELEVAWTYRAGEVDKRTQIQCNPIIKNGVLYGTAPQLKVFALEAATGRAIWEFDPKEYLASAGIEFGMNANRGVVLWEGDGPSRVFVTLSHWLICIDADTGKAISSFGDGGRTSLKQGLGDRAKNLHVISTTPGALFEDLLIVSTRVSENADAAPGHIRAFNVKTGEVAWTFHTIPQPGEFGVETWPEGANEEVGGANSWAGMSVDKERGMVFVPTDRRRLIFMEAIATARISSRIVSSRWMRELENASGIIKRFIMIFGISSVNP